MAQRDELPEETREVPPPDYLLPGVRCGLEMVVVGSIVALAGLPTESDLLTGLVLVAAVVAMVVVLFWGLNRQMAEWVRRAQGKPTLTDGSGTDRL